MTTSVALPQYYDPIISTSKEQELMHFCNCSVKDSSLHEFSIYQCEILISHCTLKKTLSPTQFVQASCKIH